MRQGQAPPCQRTAQRMHSRANVCWALFMAGRRQNNFWLTLRRLLASVRQRQISEIRP